MNISSRSELIQKQIVLVSPSSHRYCFHPRVVVHFVKLKIKYSFHKMICGNKGIVVAALGLQMTCDVPLFLVSLSVFLLFAKIYILKQSIYSSTAPLLNLGLMRQGGVSIQIVKQRIFSRCCPLLKYSSNYILYFLQVFLFN